MPSRAYASTCSFRNSTKPPLSESRTAEYIKDREKVLSEIDTQTTVQDEIRRNLIVSGGLLVMVVLGMRVAFAAGIAARETAAADECRGFAGARGFARARR